MEKLEFYIYENELWCKYADGRNKAVTESDTELLQMMLGLIRDHYPAAYKALEKEYQKSASNSNYYQFLIVRRFCKCNFGKLDTTKMDVEHSGRFNFEKVECPLRGELSAVLYLTRSCQMQNCVSCGLCTMAQQRKK